MLPRLLLGVVLAGYWGRVLAMARKARRRTGRAANLIPRERLGKWIRIVWFPVIVIWVTSPFVAVFLRAPALLRPLTDSAPLVWAGAIGALLCLTGTIACWRKMGRSWRMGIDPAEHNDFVSDGPFAFLRHPIYALSQLMMLCSLVALPTPLLVGAGAVHIGLLHWEARREEKQMERLHEDAYRRYRSRVGGFFPKL